jgi:hypothetical protein
MGNMLKVSLENDSDDDQRLTLKRQQKLPLPFRKSSESADDELSANEEPSSDSEEDYMNMAIPGAGASEQELESHAKQEEIDKYLPQQDRKLYNGLRTSILKSAGDSKGIRIMEKMGFKTGSGLGSADRKASDQPIFIQRKLGRGGVGYDEAKRRVREQDFDEHVRKQKQKKIDFRYKVSRDRVSRKTECQVLAAQKICIDLDARHQGIDATELYNTKDIGSLNVRYRGMIASRHAAEREKNLRRYMRGEISEYVESENESEEVDVTFAELSLNEQLERITDYLRSSYYYCFWCGCRFEDAKDMEENCPGEREEDH